MVLNFIVEMTSCCEAILSIDGVVGGGCVVRGIAYYDICLYMIIDILYQFYNDINTY